jgi:hypothetical protein
MAFPSVLARPEAGRFCPLVAAAALGSRCYRQESRADSHCGRRNLKDCRSWLQARRPAKVCAHATATKREPFQLLGVMQINAYFNLEGSIGEPARPWSDSGAQMEQLCLFRHSKRKHGLLRANIANGRSCCGSEIE